MQTLMNNYLMISLIFSVCISLISIILCIVVGVIAFFGWVETRSFMRSTHKVEFVPLDPKHEEQKEILRDQDLNEYDL